MQLFGIDNLSGKILWKTYIENLAPFMINGKETMTLFVQRTTRHFPRPAQCALIAKDRFTDEGIVYMFNPITGELASDIVKTGSKIKQFMLLPKHNEEFLREVLLLDDNDQVHVYPKGNYAVIVDVAKQTFIFTADSKTGILKGYSLAYSNSEVIFIMII